MKFIRVVAWVLGILTAVNLWWCWQSRRQSLATVRRLAETACFRWHEVHSRWHFFTANFIKTHNEATT